MLRKLSMINVDTTNQYTFPILDESENIMVSKLSHYQEDFGAIPVKTTTITFCYVREFIGQNTWMPKESIHIVGLNERLNINTKH